MSNILLLGDITGKDRVAIRMLTAELEARGHEVFSLPTALISNPLNLGRAEFLDTTEYLLRAWRTWTSLGLRFDALAIGYVTGIAQAQALAEIADEFRANGVPVLLDPILGDRGKKYNFILEEQVEGMRLLCAHADLITPNLTEARLLTQMDEDPHVLANRLSEGTRSVLITGCPGEDEAHGMIIGFDAQCGAAINVPFVRVPGHHFGTGDRFSALLLHGLLSGQSLQEAGRAASDGVKEALLSKI